MTLLVSVIIPDVFLPFNFLSIHTNTDNQIFRFTHLNPKPTHSITMSTGGKSGGKSGADAKSSSRSSKAGLQCTCFLIDNHFFILT